MTENPLKREIALTASPSSATPRSMDNAAPRSTLSAYEVQPGHRVHRHYRERSINLRCCACATGSNLRPTNGGAAFSSTAHVSLRN
jgi:hypothetical protein